MQLRAHGQGCGRGDDEAGTDRQTSQRQIRVLPCQEGAAKATGRMGPTGTGIESEREPDIGLEFIFKMSISLSSANGGQVHSHSVSKSSFSKKYKVARISFNLFKS